MIIDFHTHFFPDNIAERAMNILKQTGDIPNYTDGTVKDSLRLMKECGVDKAVLCSIATNPKQQINVNNFAITVNNTYSEFISFGSVHPDSEAEDIKNELKRLKDAGIKGIKLHPEYMNKYIADEAYKIIFRTCTELDLILLTHAGFDYVSPVEMRCTPYDLLKIINEYPSLKLVAAHFGGARIWDDAEKYLVGKEIWFDLSTMVSENMDKSQAYRMIQAHDPEKLLFATDMPWSNPIEDINYIKSLNLNNEIQDNIFYKNAEKLLS